MYLYILYKLLPYTVFHFSQNLPKLNFYNFLSFCACSNVGCSSINLISTALRGNVEQRFQNNLLLQFFSFYGFLFSIFFKRRRGMPELITTIIAYFTSDRITFTHFFLFYNKIAEGRIWFTQCLICTEAHMKAYELQHTFISATFNIYLSPQKFRETIQRSLVHCASQVYENKSLTNGIFSKFLHFWTLLFLLCYFIRFYNI